MYRALVAFPQSEKTKNGKLAKDDWAKAQEGNLKSTMDYFLTSKEVKPYPAPPMFNADKLYMQIPDVSQYPSSPTNAATQLNEAYANNKHKLVFYGERPKTAKVRDEHIKAARHTGVYVYTKENPDGWFSQWLYPIHNSYGGVDVQSSKLIHHGYGTPNDMLQIGDVDWDACFLPGVMFVYWSEVNKESKAKVKPTIHHHDLVERSLTDGISTDTDWARFINGFLTERLGRHGVVAMVECRF